MTKLGKRQRTSGVRRLDQYGDSLILQAKHRAVGGPGWRTKLQPMKGGELCSSLIQRDRGLTARVAIFNADEAIRKIGL